MSVLNVSIIVSEQTQILDNKLLQLDIPVTLEHIEKYREEIDQWMNDIPIPGQKKELDTRDKASLQAIQLLGIIRGRDPNVFNTYDFDNEGEAAIIERRPYNWANLDLVG